jgi:glycosyltransferase involved in cell wall biosynthesis
LVRAGSVTGGVMDGATLAIVVKGFPRLSETFIARELEALERRGLRFSLHALRAPGADAKLVDNKVRATPQYLPEYLKDAPLTVLRAFHAARKRPGFAAAWRAFRVDFSKEPVAARVRRFGQACVLVQQMPESVRHVHAHFAHSPSSVARYAALIRGIGFSISAHAKDIWTAPSWDLSHKIREATFVSVCNKAGHDRLKALDGGARLHLIYHGVARGILVDEARQQTRDGTASDDPVRIISVARAVEKKGLRRLLDALAQMPAALAFRLDHYGGGELLGELKERARSAKLDERVTWHGPRPHGEIIAALDRSDIFVLPAIVGNDGDRDGIPNAVLEAQARGLPVVVTRVGGLDEAVVDGETGLMIEPGEAAAISDALTTLIRIPGMRTALGRAALADLRARSDAEAGYDMIARLLNESLVR